jgi:HEAT repeat protein
MPLFEGVKQGYEFARRSVLIRWMAIAAALFAVLYYSVVFPFSKAVAAEFTREDDLTAFLGVFQGASMGTAFLASLFLSNRLYARFGFMTMIFAYPVLYFLGFSTLLVSAVFPLLVAFRFAQLVWSEGVSEGANQAMYNLVPPEQREQTRAFVRGVANPAGVSLIGGILLLSESILPRGSMFVLGMLAAAVTAYLVWQARGAYGQALVEALRAGRPQLFFSEEEPFGGFRRDASAVGVVIEGISSPDVAVRRVSAEILGNLAVPEAVDAMVAALDDEDPAVRAGLLRSIARAGATQAILEVVSALEDREPQVRLEAVGALRQLAGYPQGLIKNLQPLLHDPDATVRSQAAASLLSLGSHAQAEEVLKDLARNGKVPDRVEALNALATWGSQSAYVLAEKSLKDRHPAIRAAAATALARIDASQCTFALVGLLGDEDQGVRQSAARALGDIGPPAVEPALAALSDRKLERGALLALERLPLAGVQERVLSYAQERRERALYYHGLWLASQAAHYAGERLQLVKDALRNRALQHGTNALKAIALLGESAGIGLAIENLDSRHPGQRANALETLESLGKSGLVRPLLVLWEAEARPSVPAGGWLERVMQDEDPWLRACAALAAADGQKPEMRAWLARLAESDSDELVRATAQASLDGDTAMRTLQTLSLMERILFLRRVPLFLDMAPSDLKQIAGIAGEHWFANGEVIGEQGEIGEEMFIIVSGEVRVVTRGEDGNEVGIARRGAGEYVGEMAIISRAPRMASLIASGEVRALCIEQADFEELLRLRPETSLAVMRVLCERLREREGGEV